MYQILGADSKQYGPVSADVLRQWISEGRVNARTQIKPEGGTEWQTLASVPEFAPLFGPASQGGLGQPVSGAPVPAKTSALAVSSLVLGILGLFTCGITALAGLVLGIVSLVKVNRSGGLLSGRGLAIAGICTSALFLLMIPIYAAMLLPALAKAKARAQSISCMNNVKQLELAAIMYANAHGDKYPSAEHWCDALLAQGQSAKVFQCPGDSTGSRSDYAFNQNLSELPTSKVTNPGRTVLIFESDGGWNQRGGRELAVRNPRHAGWVIVGFADGHAESVPESRLGGLVWNP
jgi:prepilin-type processing-associated H-X9-DG protein